MDIALPKQVAYIIQQLEQRGFEAFAVGGCVRDTLLGREPEDWDITTSATPQEVKAIFPRTIDTGIQHGTVTVMADRVGYEVTTYRIDGEYEDGRHPSQVEFTRSLKMDLERRDFTINAMAYNDSAGLVDEFDGMGDLERRIIRCVGDAGQRFDEDALRMLRAVRFSGQLGFAIAEETEAAIRERACHLEKISAERIRVELTKLMVSPGSWQLRAGYETGMTKVFLPELDAMMACPQETPHHIYNVGEHSLKSVGYVNSFFSPNALQAIKALPEETRKWIGREVEQLDSKKYRIILAMTMLLHDVGKPEARQLDEEGIVHFHGHPEAGAQKARKILRRLTFDNDTVELVCRLIRWHDYRFQHDIRSMRRAVSKIGRDIMELLFLVQYGDILAQNPAMLEEKCRRIDTGRRIYGQIQAERQPLTIKELAVDGRDLIREGMKPGPEMGRMLERLLDLVLEEPEANQKESLLRAVRRYLSQPEE